MDPTRPPDSADVRRVERGRCAGPAAGVACAAIAWYDMSPTNLPGAMNWTET